MSESPADPDPRFDAAVRAVVDGDLTTLQTLLEQTPSLAIARGRGPFHATLLHYVAANGVEDELQRTPPNAAEVAELLLAQGAVADAWSDSYGRRATPLAMLVSSWHPFERGVQSDLVRVFVQGGAKPNGPLDDGTPLTTALVFGYTGAAETLVELGARHDNLFAAAGLGDLERVEAWFGQDGQLLAGAIDGYVPAVARPTWNGAAEIVQEAFHFAVTHNRIGVMEFLLARGAAPNGRVLGHHCELPLVQALFVHKVGIVPFLLDRRADPTLRDGKRGMTAIEHVERFGPASARPLLGMA